MKFSLHIEGDTKDAASVALFALLSGGTNSPTLSGVTPPAAPVAVTPPAAPDDNDEGEPTPVVAGELDAEGMPWDERIHATTKTKTAKNTWRKRKGVDEAISNAVEAELRQAVQSTPTPPTPAAAAAPPPAAAPPAAAPVADPAAALAAAAEPAPATPTTPAAAPVAEPATPAIDFGKFMAAVSAGMQANPQTIDAQYLANLSAQVGVEAITEIAQNPEKLLQAWNIMVADGKIATA